MHFQSSEASRQKLRTFAAMRKGVAQTGHPLPQGPDWVTYRRSERTPAADWLA